MEKYLDVMNRLKFYEKEKRYVRKKERNMWYFMVFYIFWKSFLDNYKLVIIWYDILVCVWCKNDNENCNLWKKKYR